MKKLFLLFALVAISIAVAAQGSLRSTSGAMNGTTVMNVALAETFTAKNLLVIQALCTQVDGTSEGTLILQGSVDGTSYNTLTSTEPLHPGDTVQSGLNGFITAFPNDTLTVTNGAVGSWIVKDSPFRKFRIQGTGGAGDTTTVSIKYTIK